MRSKQPIRRQRSRETNKRRQRQPPKVQACRNGVSSPPMISPIRSPIGITVMPTRITSLPWSLRPSLQFRTSCSRAPFLLLSPLCPKLVPHRNLLRRTKPSAPPGLPDRPPLRPRGPLLYPRPPRPLSSPDHPLPLCLLTPRLQWRRSLQARGPFREDLSPLPSKQPRKRKSPGE